MENRLRLGKLDKVLRDYRGEVLLKRRLGIG